MFLTFNIQIQTLYGMDYCYPNPKRFVNPELRQRDKLYCVIFL